MVLMSFADMREKRQQIPRELSTSIQIENQTVVNNSCLSNNSFESKMKTNVKVNKKSSTNKTYSADSNINSKNSRALNFVNNTNYFNNSNNPNIHISLFHPDMNSTQEVKSRVSIMSNDPNKNVIHSPASKSHRNTIKQEAISMNTLNMIQMKNPLKGDETRFFTSIDSALDEDNDGLGIEFTNLTRSQSNEYNANRLNATSSDKLNMKINNSIILEENEKITKMKEYLKLRCEKLKSYEQKIFKEKENLVQSIRQFKHKKQLYGKKYLIFNSNFSKLENELEKSKLQKQILESDKLNFLNINLMIKGSSMTDYNLSKINKLLSTVSKFDLYSNSEIKLNNVTREETIKNISIKSSIIIHDDKNFNINKNSFINQSNNRVKIFDNSRDIAYRELERERENHSVRADSVNSGINVTNSNLSNLNNDLNGGKGNHASNYKIKTDILSKPQISNGSQFQDIPISAYIEHTSPKNNKRTNIVQVTKISLNSNSNNFKKNDLSMSNKKDTSATISKINVSNASTNIVSISNVYSSNPFNKQNLDTLNNINSPKGKSNRPASMQVFKQRIFSEEKNIYNKQPENGIKISQVKKNSEVVVDLLKNNKVGNTCTEKPNGIENNINYTSSPPVTNKNSIGNPNFKKAITKNVNQKFRKEVSGSFVQPTPTTHILNTIIQGNNITISTQKSVVNVRKK